MASVESSFSVDGSSGLYWFVALGAWAVAVDAKSIVGGFMIRDQRQRHRRIWWVLGPLLLLVLGYAIATRQDVPPQALPSSIADSSSRSELP